MAGLQNVHEYKVREVRRRHQDKVNEYERKITQLEHLLQQRGLGIREPDDSKIYGTAKNYSNSTNRKITVYQEDQRT